MRRTMIQLFKTFHLDRFVWCCVFFISKKPLCCVKKAVDLNQLAGYVEDMTRAVFHISDTVKDLQDTIRFKLDPGERKTDVQVQKMVTDNGCIKFKIEAEGHELTLDIGGLGESMTVNGDNITKEVIKVDVEINNRTCSKLNVTSGFFVIKIPV